VGKAVDKKRRRGRRARILPKRGRWRCVAECQKA